MSGQKLNYKQVLLIALLIIVSVLVRLNTWHQGTYDSFVMHAMSDSISIHGYAKWVLHPVSLFGYYPLSYPSGLMYFLSVFSTISGINMDYSIQLFSIIIGVAGTLALFMLVYRVWSFYAALIVSLAFSLSPYYLYYTAWNASARIMVVFFSIILLWCIYKFLKSANNNEKILYSLLILIIAVFGFLFHRTGQLMLVYLVAFIATCAYVIIPKIFKLAGDNPKIRHFVDKRYKRNPNKLKLDIIILLLWIVTLKLFDLAIRKRLLINFQRMFEKVVSAYTFFFGSALRSTITVSFILLLIFIAYIKRKNLKQRLVIYADGLIKFCKKEPERAISLLILTITSYYFLRQFFGKSFYSPSLQEYYSGTLISGSQAYVVFINFIINYFTTVTILLPFVVIGFLYLIFRKNKTSFEMLILFICIGIAGILLDKRYVKLFTIPIFAILVGLGFVAFMEWLNPRLNIRLKKLLMKSFIGICILLLLAGAFFPILRSIIFSEGDDFHDLLKFRAGGQYLKSLNCNCSTVTTDELVASIIIFSESGIPGASFNVYYYIEKDRLKVTISTFDDVKNTILSGGRVTDLWALEDWLLGGQYYVGRHAKLVFENKFNEPRVLKVMEDYREKYYIHDKSLKPNTYYDSIKNVKNKVYDNPVMAMYDMRLGRA